MEQPRSISVSTDGERFGGRHGQATTTPYLFGDLLALARLAWVRRMAEGAADHGYQDYRRSDAALLRLLRRWGSVPLSGIGARLGVTRQAARKAVSGLEQRGYAAERRDDHDARIVRVALTAAGEAYADAVIEVVQALNHDLSERVNAADLAVATSVLRATFGDERTTSER